MVLPRKRAKLGVPIFENIAKEEHEFPTYPKANIHMRNKTKVKKVLPISQQVYNFKKQLFGYLHRIRYD